MAEFLTVMKEMTHLQQGTGHGIGGGLGLLMGQKRIEPLFKPETCRWRAACQEQPLRHLDLLYLEHNGSFLRMGSDADIWGGAMDGGLSAPKRKKKQKQQQRGSTRKAGFTPVFDFRAPDLSSAEAFAPLQSPGGGAWQIFIVRRGASVGDGGNRPPPTAPSSSSPSSTRIRHGIADPGLLLGGNADLVLLNKARRHVTETTVRRLRKMGFQSNLKSGAEHYVRTSDEIVLDRTEVMAKARMKKQRAATARLARRR